MLLRVAVLLFLFAGSLCAQQDTTPPVLLELSIVPAVMDTGPGPVDVGLCYTIQDDVSGIQKITITAMSTDGNPSLFQRVRFINSPGNSPVSECTQATAAQFAPYGVYKIQVDLTDLTGNERLYHHPDISNPGTDLCAADFPCEVENRPGGGLPDGDGDGVPDDSDNCPSNPNADQSDVDLDLLGDVCDPFPDDRDNEQAQCEADLAQCLSRPVPDADGDGEADTTDRCAGTPAAGLVDGDGCSQEQFCAEIDATNPDGARVCRRADWRNDEPIMRRSEADCMVSRNAAGSDDDACVPAVVTSP